MIIIKVFLLLVACLLAGYLYVTIYKSHLNLDAYYRFPIALDVGQMTSFTLCILIYIVFPSKFIVSCALNIWIGAFIGVLFCSMKDAKSSASGFFCGGLAAIMGTMVGAMAVNPTLCGLAISKLPIENPSLAVGVFGLVLLASTVFLVRYLLEMMYSGVSS